jgi:phosphatidylglycerophosphatase A
MLAVAFVATVMCLVWGDAAERAIRKKDPSHVVIDEVAGQAVALLLVWTPSLAAGGMASLHHGLITAGSAFLLFRAYDILKPPPIRGLQKFHGGAGIVIDDLAAGLAAGLTQLILRALFA